MGVNDDGLQLSHDLVFRQSFGCAGLQAYRSVGQHRHGFHVAEKQGRGNQISRIRIIGKLGLFAGGCLHAEILRNIEDAIDLSLLHCGPRFAERAGAEGYPGLFEGFELAHQVARSLRIVQIHHGDGQILGQPFLHQREEKEHADQWSYENAKQIDWRREQAMNLPPHDRLDMSCCLFKCHITSFLYTIASG